MNCTDLTQIIEEIRPLREEFLTKLEYSKLCDALLAREKIENLLGEYFSEFPDLSGDFLGSIMGKNFQKLAESIENDTPLHPDNIPVVYREFPATQREFDKVLKQLQREWRSGENTQEFLGRALVLFLAVYGKSKKPIKIKHDQLPPDVSLNFGKYLSGGNMEIDRLEIRAFKDMFAGRVKLGEFNQDGADYPSFAEKMMGGIIEVDDVSGNVGKEMYGGTIIAKNMHWGNVMTGAKGGTLYLKNYLAEQESKQKMLSGAEICFGMEKGTCFIENVNLPNFMIGAKEGSTVLIKGNRSSINNSHRKNAYATFKGEIACYDEEKDEVQFIHSQHKIFNVELGTGSAVNFAVVKFVKWKQGIGKLNISDELKAITFSGMTGGIVFLSGVNDHSKIGKGMKGGILILDDPKIKSVEEAKARVVPANQREGGVILYMKRWTEGKMFKKKRVEFVVL